MLITGGCLCVQLRYEISGNSGTQMICHCKDCQRQTGSAISTIFTISRDDIEFRGMTKTYDYQADSGRKVSRNFCPQCGSPVYVAVETMPDRLIVMAGSLDDTGGFLPQLQIWTDSKQRWIDLGDIKGIARHPV